jgi:dienelactone hydrolase
MSPQAESPVPSRPRRSRWWIAAAVGGVVAAAALAFLVWALTPLGPSSEALAALNGTASVSVVEVNGGWVFTSSSEAIRPATGLVFYPGGRVDARSYAPLALDLAAQGHVVAIAEMPLSLAVFDVDAADRFIGSDQLSYVERWAVGGHSLGGAMAAQYAAGTPVDGLALLAAYAAEGADLSSGQTAVVDVIGTEDGVLNQQAWAEGQSRLPSSARTVRIEGGNHAQFGSYGPQPGDNPATISEIDQRAAAVAAVDAMLDEM